MSLETGTRIADLVATNPVGATDFASQGDDHIRLIKACVQGSFPSLGATAVLATGVELNFVDGVTSSIQTQLDAKLGTAAAAAAYQPLDTDLTSIAALSTAGYGRDFLTLADNAALAAKIAAMAPTWSGVHIFNATYIQFGTSNGYIRTDTANTFAFQCGSSGYIWLNAGAGANLMELLASGQLKLNTAGTNSVPTALFSSTRPYIRWDQSNAAANERHWNMQADGGEFVFSAINDAFNAATEVWKCTRSGVGVPEIFIGVPARIPKVKASTSTTLVSGQQHHITGNATLPALAEGEWVAIVNNSASAITITEHSGDTTYWTALGDVSVSTLTVPARGRILASGAGSSVVYVSGDISGYT